MRDLIKELKENKRPFGLMDKELQDKAREIGFHRNFRIYLHPGFGGIINNPVYGHSCTETYQLRHDYQEEPEFVYGEIDEANPSLYSIDGINRRRLWEVPPNHERIGFKFEHGKYAIVPVIYEHNSGTTCFWGNTKNIQAGEVKVIHATHVVLRKRCK